MSIDACPASSTTDWLVEWNGALDALELDVDRAESLLQHNLPTDVLTGTMAALAGWTPPRMHSPLPQQLLARAEAIVERQLSVAERLGSAMADSRRHSRLAARLESGVNSHRVPAFLDSRT